MNAYYMVSNRLSVPLMLSQILRNASTLVNCTFYWRCKGNVRGTQRFSLVSTPHPLPPSPPIAISQQSMHWLWTYGVRTVNWLFLLLVVLVAQVAPQCALWYSVGLNRETRCLCIIDPKVQWIKMPLWELSFLSLHLRWCSYRRYSPEKNGDSLI